MPRKMTPYASRLSFLLVASLTYAACSFGETPGTETDRDSAVAAADLLRLLPANTRALALVDMAKLRDGNPLAQIEDLLQNRDTDPAVRAPLASIERLARSLDISTDIDRLVLLQTTAVENGLGLLVKLRATREHALDTSALTARAAYRGVEVFEHSSGVRVAVLPEGIVVAAEGAGLEALLDVHTGSASALSQGGDMAPYLAALHGPSPIQFITALPGMYKTIGTPGPGAATLRTAKALSGVFDMAEAAISGELSVHTDIAEAFVTRFNEIQGPALESSLALAPPVAAGLPASVVLAVDASPVYKSPELLLRSRHAFKQLFHSMDAVDYADGVADGGNPPWLNFNVGGSPNSIFVDFEIQPEKVAAFEANELPAGFKLAPVRILDTDEPTNFLVLNIYNSSGGLTQGARAEWSVFVRDPDGEHPRFLVLQAKASSTSADPINLLTMPEPVSHELQGERIVSHVGVTDGDSETNYWTSSIVWPQSPETRVATAREFVAANDYIFWGNGVADRGLYNATVHNRDAVLIDASDIAITDDSHWAQYIASTPKHTYVYTTPLEIVVSPWWNLDAAYLDTTKEHVDALRGFRDGFYPTLVRNIAAAAVRGEDRALVGFQIANTVPSTHVNFVITDPAALSSAIGLPAAYELAQLKLLASDPRPEYYLTLKVYEVRDAPEGLRAEWLVYVHNGDGRARAMLIDRMTAEAAIDPGRFLSLPSLVKHEAVGSVLHTAVSRGDLSFKAALDTLHGSSVVPSLDWVETNDYVCHLNGVCDKQFYDGGTLEEPFALLDAASVALAEFATPWDGLVESTPRSVFIRHNVQQFAANPWINVTP